MRYLLNPVGSSGDVHPFIGIGRELKARGHEVVIFAPEPHRAVSERNGLEFVATATMQEYHEATEDPDLWHPRRGVETVLRMIVPSLERTRKALEERYQPGRTLIVGHPLGFAARTFEEQTGAPAITIHLAPSSLRSAYKVPALPPGTDISFLPLWLKQAFWAGVDRFAVDPMIVPQLNRWRATLGLPAVHRVFKDWLNSPGMVIGLFPEWFGPRQPDWPPDFHSTSFPLWDDPGTSPMGPELSGFLDQGTSPVVASPGSANRHATPFFTAVAEALKTVGRRGVFLTGYPEQLPPGLPDSIMFRPYAPFSMILPRAALLVHHGGIGTLAQGLSAGVPQLIMPMAFDQPDNAFRVQALGVARWLTPRRFTGERVTGALRELLDNPSVARSAAQWRDRLQAENGIAKACDLIERRMGG
jgi:UDP:flavonoid glycosyltransferase YjiC (YdhE family)